MFAQLLLLPHWPRVSGKKCNQTVMWCFVHYVSCCDTWWHNGKCLMSIILRTRQIISIIFLFWSYYKAAFSCCFLLEQPNCSGPVVCMKSWISCLVFPNLEILGWNLENRVVEVKSCFSVDDPAFCSRHKHGGQFLLKPDVPLPLTLSFLLWRDRKLNRDPYDVLLSEA